MAVIVAVTMSAATDLMCYLSDLSFSHFIILNTEKSIAHWLETMSMSNLKSKSKFAFGTATSFFNLHFKKQ